MKKIILLIAVCFLAFAGCRAKKQETRTEKTIKTDSTATVKTDVIKELEKTKETVTPPVKETVLIKQPCDETGKIKPFHNVYNTGRGRVEVFTDSLGNIQVKIDLPEVKNTEAEKSRDQTSENKEFTAKNAEKEILGSKVIEIIPLRYWIYTIGLGITTLLFLFLWLYSYFKKKVDI